LEFVKGDRFPIGGALRLGERDYSTYILDYQKTAKIYLYTDGYPDQLGGEGGTKFKSVNLKKLISEICDEPMDVQKSRLENAIMSWRKDPRNQMLFPQVDDITVVGLMINGD
jgi:hypothetical protein